MSNVASNDNLDVGRGLMIENNLSNKWSTKVILNAGFGVNLSLTTFSKIDIRHSVPRLTDHNSILQVRATNADVRATG